MARKLVVKFSGGKLSPSMRRRKAEGACLSAAILMLILIGCAVPVRVRPATDTVLRAGVPVNQGLVYGRIVVRGWSPTVQGDYGTSVEFRNRTTGQTYIHRLNALGDFHWLLVPGNYEVTGISSGLEGVSQRAKDRGIYFSVPARAITYLGDLFVQLPSLYSNGTVNLFDDFSTATRHLYRGYPSIPRTASPAKLLFTIPGSNK